MTDPDGAAPVRVFLADDHPVSLAGMKALVAADPRLALVGEAGDGPAALGLAIALRPDVAVLDISMPGLSGVEVARKLLAARPACRVVMLTMHEEIAYPRRLLDIGVAGYVLKRSATPELIRSIHAVAAGGTWLDPAIAGAVLGRAPPPPAPCGRDEARAIADLSARETEVLRLTAVGHSNKMIADRLGIGLRSVDTYKARAMAKLGFRGRVDVINLALSQGWLGEPGSR